MPFSSIYSAMINDTKKILLFFLVDFTNNEEIKLKFCFRNKSCGKNILLNLLTKDNRPN